MLRSVGPNLNKLELTGFTDDLGDLLDCEWLENLPQLKIEFNWNFGEISTFLHKLTGLRKLEIYAEYPGKCCLERSEESNLIKMIALLPNLVELKVPSMHTRFKVELELRQYLNQANRTLRLNAGEMKLITNL